jgi:hypothetical protein
LREKVRVVRSKSALFVVVGFSRLILHNLQGVTPATIAVRDGVCRVGLTFEELVDLAKAGPEGRATKCSTRELSLMMANSSRNVEKDGHQWGGTHAHD